MSYDPSTAYAVANTDVVVPDPPTTTPADTDVVVPDPLSATPADTTVAQPVPLYRDRRHFDETGVAELNEHGQETHSEPHFPGA